MESNVAEMRATNNNGFRYLGAESPYGGATITGNGPTLRDINARRRRLP